MTSVTGTHVAPPSMRRKNRYTRHLYNAYDLDLKKSVVIFAEENGNKEAQARYGISEANIRRWRRLKNDIFGKPHDYDRGKLRSRKRVNYNYKVEKVSCDSVEQESQSSVGESTGRRQAYGPVGAGGAGKAEVGSSHSMPLQERLSKVAAQEKMAAGAAGPLKSQPLSPTKLKVTRQSPKAKQVEPPQSPVNEEMCLRWNSHHSNMQTAFPNILSKEQYVDVTLAAEGKTLKCHRLILSSCSPYFEEILSGISPFQHPVLFMRDIPFWILKSLCDFMYAGEVHIFQNKLEELLTVAEALKIKGLAGKSTPPENQEENPQKSENNNSNNNSSTNNKEKKKQPQEKEKTQQQPPLKKNPVFTQTNNFESTSHDYDDDLLDPLDLLEPLYEEAAEEKKPASTVVKPKENKYQYQPMKKPFTRRLRKRKYSEQREPSPPPVFSFRKGTRSRPNVKIPKYYHSDYSNPTKPASNAQTDPLLDVDEIKTEPIDVEDNLIVYSDEDHYMENSLEPANCDSPIIITSTKPAVPPQPDKFKKIKLSKPIITEVHTIEESNTTAGGLEVIKITVQQPEELNKKVDRGDEGDPLLGVIITENVEGVEEPAVVMETEEAPAEVVRVAEDGQVEEVEGGREETETGEGVGESGTEEVAKEVPVPVPEIPEIKIADVSTVEEEQQPEGDVQQVEGVEVQEGDQQVDQPVEETEQQNEVQQETEEVNQQEEQQPEEVNQQEEPHPEEVNQQEEQQPEEVNQPEEQQPEVVEEVTQEEPVEATDQPPEEIPQQEAEVNEHVDERVDERVDEGLQEIEGIDQIDQPMDEMSDLQQQSLEEVDQLVETVEQQMDEDDPQGGMTSLDHLEKEAMNVVNVINMENQAGPPDIE
ncbi:midasin-like isoform X3 [Zophobas morio]|uniref:midasin-like isoform X3 n=1 Tax=Zophobas morio TaxID=2755281 RepID=UPI003082D129